MNISYTQPLARAWERMKIVLFRPFRIETWLVIGFAAFLVDVFKRVAGSARGWNGGSSWKHTPGIELGNAVEALRDRALELMHNTVLVGIIVTLLIVGAIVALVMAWIGARARFVFMNQTATGNPAFVAPWQRYGRLGTSLFLWEVAFSFTYLLPLACLVVPFLHLLAQIIRSGEITWPPLASMVLGIGGAVLLVIVLTAVRFVLHEFVVPLMYRHDEGATAAWARFWPLFTSQFGTFLVYLVFRLVLGLVVGTGLVIVGVATCCIGLALMLIPYVSSVVLLPIELTARAYGPEFLAQFGPEWTTLAELSPTAATPSEPPPPPHVMG